MMGVMESTGEALVARLRAMLGSRTSARGTLPGEPTLADELGASRPALREALTRLEVEGLVSRRRGSGTTVNPEAGRIAVRFDQQVELTDVIERAGSVAGLEVLEAGPCPLPPATAEVLGCEPGTHGFRSVKRWTADGVPVMVAVDEFPLPDDSVSVDVPTSLFATVAEVSGRNVEWEVARPTAALPDPQVSEWLGGRTDPVLVLDLLGVARDGARLYRAVEFHVPGAFDFGFVRTVTG